MARGPNVYAVSRELWDHPIFKAEPYTEAQAWAWLIGAAAWKQIHTRGNVGAVRLERGEFSFAVRFLAKKWRWEKDRSHRFMLKLKKHDMVRDTERDGNHVYSINNYNKFQVVGAPQRDSDQDTARDTNATAPRQHRDKEETGETGESISSLRSEKPSGQDRRFASQPKAKPGEDLPPWLDRDAWNGFCEMRRRKRAPLTGRAQAQIIRKLDRWRALGHDPTAILDQSTEKAWTTIYEPKPENSNGHRAKQPSAHDKFFAGGAAFIRDLIGDGDDGQAESGPDSDAALEAGRALLPP